MFDLLAKHAERAVIAFRASVARRVSSDSAIFDEKRKKQKQKKESERERERNRTRNSAVSLCALSGNPINSRNAKIQGSRPAKTQPT